jgi:hypothetical protein
VQGIFRLKFIPIIIGSFKSNYISNIFNATAKKIKNSCFPTRPVINWGIPRKYYTRYPYFSPISESTTVASVCCSRYSTYGRDNTDCSWTCNCITSITSSIQFLSKKKEGTTSYWMQTCSNRLPV